MADERPARTPPPARASLSRTVMFMMLFLTLFVFIDETLRNAFGAAAGAVLGPTIGFGAAFPVITILLAGSITTIVSAVVRHVFTDWVRMTRVNREMGALRKAMMEAMRRGNPSKVDKLKALQTSMQKDTIEVQFQPMKSMAFTFLFFIVVFAWLNTFVYLEVFAQGRVFFSVPWSPTVDLRETYLFPAWILLYSLLAIPASQVATRLLKLLSFRRRLAAEAQVVTG